MAPRSCVKLLAESRNNCRILPGNEKQDATLLILVLLTEKYLSKQLARFYSNICQDRLAGMLLWNKTFVS